MELVLHNSEKYNTRPASDGQITFLENYMLSNPDVEEIAVEKLSQHEASVLITQIKYEKAIAKKKDKKTSNKYPNPDGLATSRQWYLLNKLWEAAAITTKEGRKESARTTGVVSDFDRLTVGDANTMIRHLSNTITRQVI